MLSSIRSGCMAIIIGSSRKDSPNIGRCVTCVRQASDKDNVIAEAIRIGAWYVEAEGLYSLRELTGWAKVGYALVNPKYLMPITPDESFKEEEKDHAKVHTN